MSATKDATLAVAVVGGFDSPPCEFCRRERPCSCGPIICRCSCGRCLYPGPLPDDGPLPAEREANTR